MEDPTPHIRATKSGYGYSTATVATQTNGAGENENGIVGKRKKKDILLASKAWTMGKEVPVYLLVFLLLGPHNFEAGLAAGLL